MNALLLILPFVLYSAGLASGQPHEHPIVTLETPEDSICPPDSELEAARMNVVSNVSSILQDIAAGFITTYTVPECGGSGWRQVAFLNMTDPNQQCPDSWEEYVQDSVRACGRRESSVASCDSVEYSSDGLVYTHVCGRIIGYRVGGIDGIFSVPIDGVYVDGVSITYGNPRQHIWTFYGAQSETQCCGSNRQPSTFVGQSYFCDVGNPLWDNDDNCLVDANCCSPHSGPWFNTTLTAPTTEDIEIRICATQSAVLENTPLELIEIFVM